jgi:hypothetical protein
MLPCVTPELSFLPVRRVRSVCRDHLRGRHPLVIEPKVHNSPSAVFIPMTLGVQSRHLVLRHGPRLRLTYVGDQLTLIQFRATAPVDHMPRPSKVAEKR